MSFGFSEDKVPTALLALFAEIFDSLSERISSMKRNTEPLTN